VKVVDKRSKGITGTRLSAFVTVCIRHCRKVETSFSFRDFLIRDIIGFKDYEIIAEKVYSEIVKTLTRLGVEIVSLKSKSRGFKIVVKGGTRIIGSVRKGIGEYVIVTVKIIRPIPLSTDYTLFGNKGSKFLIVKKIIHILNNIKISS